MLNKQKYIKGRNKEYKIIADLKKQGYDIAQRTAGSHSLIDIIAINKNLKIIKFIQSKGFNISENQLKEIQLNSDWLNADKGGSGAFSVKFEVI